MSDGTQGTLPTNLVRRVVEYDHAGRLTGNGLRFGRIMSLRCVWPGRYPLLGSSCASVNLR